MDNFRGIVFRDGPTGRRAASIDGPDVWEVMATLASGEAYGEEAIIAIADLLNLTDFQARTAVRYYGAFGDEIDRRITLNTAGADEVEATWKRAQAADWGQGTIDRSKLASRGAREAGLNYKKSDRNVCEHMFV